MSSTNYEAQHCAVFSSHLLIHSSRFIIFCHMHISTLYVSCSIGPLGLRPLPVATFSRAPWRYETQCFCDTNKRESTFRGHTNTAQPACITQNAAVRSGSTERFEATRTDHRKHFSSATVERINWRFEFPKFDEVWSSTYLLNGCKCGRKTSEFLAAVRETHSVAVTCPLYWAHVFVLRILRNSLRRAI
jgi:hypothetical protein